MKRIISLFLVLCIVVTMVPPFTLPAAAQITKREDWDSETGKTVNLIPALKANDNIFGIGWGSKEPGQIDDTAYETSNSAYKNKYVIRAKTKTDDIGDSDFTGGVYWQINFSAEDKVRINKDDLRLTASARYWFMTSSHHYISLRFEFYDAQNTLIDDSHKKTFDKYYVGQENPTLELSKVKIPANTEYVQIWFSNWGSLAGRPFIGDMEAYLTDVWPPKPEGEVYEYSVNGSTTLPDYVVPGDVVTYALRFNEAVSTKYSPRITLSNGITKTFSQVEYSEDGQTVYLPVEMTNTGKNEDLRITEIDVYVADDAGNDNAYLRNKVGTSIGTLSYRSLFDVTQNLTNLTSTGAATIRFGRNYTAKLTPDAGYKLPDNITVKVGGAAVSDYTYNSSTGDIKINSAAIRGDIEITAAAQPRTYTVTFDMQGGKGGTSSAQATYTQTMPDVNVPSRDGYTFGGYFDGKNGTGTQYYDINGTAQRKYDKVSDATLYAKWTPKSYTVSLDAAGGGGSQTVTAVYDADMPSVSMPARTGYTFLGYFTMQNGSGVKYYNANGTSARKYDKTDGLTLYAAWSANSYNVTFDIQGGKGGTASTKATYDAKMPTVIPPSRTGYTFDGYFEGADGRGAQYYYANGEGAKLYDVDGDITLYAKWTADTYDVVLNAQGGSGGSTITATFDSAMPPIAAPDKPGYVFGGYFDGKNGTGTKYYNADCSSAHIYDKAEGITLYALWTPVTYNIQLYSRGENVATLKNVVYGELTLPSDKNLGISFPNYKFVGWNIYDEQNWAMYTSGRTYSVGLVTEQGKTAYVYAAWLEKDKYTVTYDANGGEGAPSAVEVHTDETITLSGTVPSRQNYTFVGWSEKSDSVSASYQPNDSFTMGNSLVTLFAVWKKNPELTYNANGGTFGTYAGASYPPAGSTVTLTGTVPQKEGYVFLGWAESADATRADIVPMLYVMPDSDTVLYAVYEPVKYTVSVSAADGYSVSGINAGGYMLGEYAEFTVNGASPKVYVNGVPVQPANGVYKFEIKGNSSVVVADSSLANVIYNANGGINAPVDVRTYSNGDTAYVKTEKPVRTGYKFVGWALKADSENAAYTGGEGIVIISEDVVLYAVWEPITYSIKYDANGADGNMSATAAVYDRTVSLSKNAFTKTGCQFAGWSYAPDGEIAYPDGANVKNLTDIQNDEITLYAVWKGARTKINFRFEGGSLGTVSCEAVYGKLIPSEKLEAPERYGYTFAGYYTSANKGGRLVYNSDMTPSDYYQTNTWDNVADEFDLYAAWEPISYTVAFVDGTETLGTVSAVYANKFSLPKADALGISVPNGYTFAGWSVAPGSDTVYYHDGQEITAGLSGENGAVVYLYAVILKNVSYTVTLPASGEGYKVYYNDAEVTSAKDINVNKGDNVSFKISVQDGYSADKMTVSANGVMLGAVKIDGNDYFYNINCVSADTSVNIYHVKREAFRIILNDGTGYQVSPKNTVVESGDDFSFTVTLSQGYETAIPTVYVNGNTLSAVKNGNVYMYTLSNVTSQPVISISVTSKRQYTVTFASNGGIYSIGTVEENMKAAQPGNPERNGYVFGGWYTDAECTHPYDFQSEVTGDVKLYAKWTANTYAVEYNKNTADNAAVPMRQIKKHDSVLVLSSEIPSVNGYTFVQWNTKPDGTGTSYGAGSELSVNADITLYAQWKINKFSVTLITGDGITGSLGANEVEYGKTVAVTAASSDGFDEPVISAIPQENAELVSPGVYRITGPVSFVAAARAKEIYTANFYFDGGLYYTQSAIEDSAAKITLPHPPIKTGHSFVGWYTQNIGGAEVNETTSLDKNMSVYARFAANTLNITPAQDGEGYAVSSNGSTTVSYDGSYTFTVTLAEHYNADNMKVYANGVLLTGTKNGNAYDYTIENIVANQTITVTGVELDKHTVTYMVDGQMYLTVQTDYNTLLSEPTSPKISGKTFKGWSDNGRIWDFATDKVIFDMTLSAVWDSDTFTVTPAQNGEGYEVSSNDSTDVPYGGNYTFTVTLADHYNADNMKVYANGVLLSGTENNKVYTYTIKNIVANQTITVTGVELDKHTVTYMVDGQMYLTVQTDYNTLLSEPTSPKISGNTFKGWSDNGRIWDFATDKVISDMTLSAVWVGDTFTVTPAQNGDGYTINSSDSTDVPYGGNYTFTVTLKEHYNADNMKVYANGVLLSGTKNGNAYDYTIENIVANQIITVTGVELDNHTVTYMVDGQVYHTVVAKYNSLLSEPTSPKISGKTFKGWSYNGKIWNFAADKVTSDMTLSAVWDSDTFTVTPAQNGEGYTVTSNDSITVSYGGNYTFTVTLAEHYNADNMKVYANGVLLTGTKTGNAYDYTIENIVANQIITVTGVELDKHTVTYIVDGQVYQTVVAKYNSRLSEPTSPKISGKTFKGWSYNGKIWDFATDKVTSDMTLSAVWVGDIFTVTPAQNGEGYTVSSDDSTTVSYGGSYTFTVTLADHYNADNMKVYANGVLLSGTENNKVYTYTIKNIVANQIITVTGVELDKHTVTYMVDGQVYQTVVAKYDSLLSEPTSPKISGKTFNGWSDNTKIWDFAADKVTSDMTLSAVWVGDTFTVIPAQDGNGYTVTSNDSTDVPYGGNYIFTVTLEEHYNADNMKVYANGVLLTGTKNGNAYDYTIENIVANQTITVTGVELDKHTVTYMVDGQMYLTVQTDYNTLLAEPTSPKISGKTFNGWSDNTKIWNFATDKVISDMTLSAVWVGDTFTVTPAQNGDGYTVTSNDSTTVSYGGNYTFTVTLKEHYNADNMKVYANGVLLSGTENNKVYTYTIKNIVANQTITVTGVELDKHTVTYMVDGQMYLTVQATYNTLLAEPTSPKISGKTFKGWSDNTKIWDFAADKVTSVMTLSAVWVGDTFTVIPAQDGEGYTVDSSDSTEVPYGGNYTFTVTLEEHYNADNMKVYANGVLLSGTENNKVYTYTIKNIVANQTITVTGVELDKHTVTYMVDGQVYQTVVAKYDSLLSEPTSPKISGKTFNGWSDNTKIWDFAADKVTSDMTLSAVWDSDTFTVTPAQNGDGYTVSSNDSTDVPYGGNYTFTVTLKEHYNADNMKVYANGILLTGTKTGNAYTYTVKNITDNVTIIVTDVVPDIYTVKYMVDGEIYHSEKVVYTVKAQMPKSPVKPGHTFAGWFDGNDEWDFESEICEDLELEAKFDVLTYQITVPADNSEFTVNVTTGSAGYGGNLEFSITVSDGYDASDMTVYANGVLLERISEDGNTLYFEISNVTESKVITVKGIGQNTYSITYKANTSDYVGNMPENVIKTHGTDVKISDMIPERHGYTFAGWSAEDNGDAEYFGGDVYSENSDITLYAVWEAKTFAVIFETNGGTINEGEITGYTYGKGAVLPTDVSKEYYDFAGWYEDENLSGVRVTEIKDTDYGDKKYYAAYNIAGVKVNGYTGEYDGKAHDITYTLADNLSAENYQWYFVSEDSGVPVAVYSDSYDTYKVKDVSQSGQYYCYVEALMDGYVIRFFTEKATVSISKKPVTVKAASSSKVFDAKPLLTNAAELSDGTSLADNHTLSAVMTAESSITDVGTAENIIDRVIITDGENADVTQNYEITAQNGTLSVTPLTLTVAAKNLNAGFGSSLDGKTLYEISGMLRSEKLSLANVVYAAKNAADKDVSLSDITKNAGKYTVEISYDGFEGDGSGNYTGSGTITSVVTVAKKNGGGFSGGGFSGGGTSGGDTKTSETYTVDFVTNGAGKIESQSVKEGNTAKEPEMPERKGYTFEGWYSDKELSEEFDFNSKITKNITLFAKWSAAEKVEENQPEDLPSSDPSKTGVSKLLETKNHIAYLNGNGDNTFKPEKNMTRAEAVQVFYNLLLDKNVSGNSSFKDVSKDAWYYNAVKTLADMGIINGVGGNIFNPDGAITRAEFVAIAMRFSDVSVNGSKHFSDVSNKHWAAKNISDAACLGWVSGYDDGTFCPDKFITRAAVAKIVNNMLDRKADAEYVSKNKNSVKLFDDVSPSAWYYEDVVEASNAHGYEKSGENENWK